MYVVSFKIIVYNYNRHLWLMWITIIVDIANVHCRIFIVNILSLSFYHLAQTVAAEYM